MFKNSDGTIQFDQCTYTIHCHHFAKNLFHHNFFATPHQWDAGVSLKGRVLMTREPCVILGSKAVVSSGFCLFSNL